MGHLREISEHRATVDVTTDGDLERVLGGTGFGRFIAMVADGTAQDGAHAVWMTGPARTVFQGEIDFPENLGL
jgi:hypothetical protein